MAPRTRQSIDLIRRPAQGSNENVGTPAQRNVYTQRFFAMAACASCCRTRQPRSESADRDTAGARVAERHRSCGALYPVLAGHSHVDAAQVSDRHRRDAWIGFRALRVASCRDTSTRAITKNRCSADSSRSKFSGSLPSAWDRPKACGRMLRPKCSGLGSRAGTWRTRIWRSALAGTPYPVRLNRVPFLQLGPAISAPNRIRTPSFGCSGSGTFRVMCAPCGIDTDTAANITATTTLPAASVGQPERPRLLAQHALRHARGTDAGWPGRHN